MSRGAGKLRSRELKAKIAHKLCISEGLDREVQTVDSALSAFKIQR